jgi:hypothetical protein
LSWRLPAWEGLEVDEADTKRSAGATTRRKSRIPTLTTTRPRYRRRTRNRESITCDHENQRLRAPANENQPRLLPAQAPSYPELRERACQVRAADVFLRLLRPKQRPGSQFESSPPRRSGGVIVEQAGEGPAEARIDQEADPQNRGLDQPVTPLARAPRRGRRKPS